MKSFMCGTASAALRVYAAHEVDPELDRLRRENEALRAALHAALSKGWRYQDERSAHEPGCDLANGGTVCSCSPWKDG